MLTAQTAANATLLAGAAQPEANPSPNPALPKPQTLTPIPTRCGAGGGHRSAPTLPSYHPSQVRRRRRRSLCNLRPRRRHCCRRAPRFGRRSAIPPTTHTAHYTYRSLHIPPTLPTARLAYLPLTSPTTRMPTSFSRPCGCWACAGKSYTYYASLTHARHPSRQE